MESAPPTAPARKKRPFFLFMALTAAWVFGVAGIVDGCGTVAYFRHGDASDTSFLVRDIKSDRGRAEVRALAAQLLATRDAAKSRLFPLAVAALVLGSALVVLSARATAGRESARHALVQVVAAQVGLLLASYALTRDVRLAEAEFGVGLLTAQAREAGQDADTTERVVALYPAAASLGPPLWLAIRTLASGLVLFALTRPRARAFFDANSDPISER